MSIPNMSVIHNANNCIKAAEVIDLSDPALATEWVFSDTDSLYYTFGAPIVCSMGILGNSAFLMSVITTSSLQSSLTALMCNLAITDIFFLAMSTIWSTIDYMTSEVLLDYPVYSNLTCYILVISVYIPYFTSLGFITLISMERYLAICLPIRHHMMKGRKRTCRLIVVVWVIGFALSILYAFGHVLTPTCFIWPEDEVYEHLAANIDICKHNVFPLVMAICLFVSCLLINGIITYKIIAAMMKRKVVTNSEQVQSALYQVTRTLVINIVVFFLCQLPIRIAFLNKIFDEISGINFLNFRSAYSAGFLFLLLNSCINPVLYVCCCRIYRHAMRNTLTKLCCSIAGKNVDQMETNCRSRHTDLELQDTHH